MIGSMLLSVLHLKAKAIVLDNYRGISIYQVIAQNHSNEFLFHFDSYCVNADQQHCFSTNHSCETALHSIIDNWKVSFSQKK